MKLIFSLISRDTWLHEKGLTILSAFILHLKEVYHSGFLEALLFVPWLQRSKLSLSNLPLCFY